MHGRAPSAQVISRFFGSASSTRSVALRGDLASLPRSADTNQHLCLRRIEPTDAIHDCSLLYKLTARSSG
jgi:hypothetical protein